MQQAWGLLLRPQLPQGVRQCPALPGPRGPGDKGHTELPLQGQDLGLAENKGLPMAISFRGWLGCPHSISSAPWGLTLTGSDVPPVISRGRNQLPWIPRGQWQIYFD